MVKKQSSAFFSKIRKITPNPGSDYLRLPKFFVLPLVAGQAMLNDHSLSFRQCTQADIPLLKSIGYQSYSEHYLYLWTEERFAEWYMSLSFGEESLLKQMNDPKVAFFLIFLDDQPVGQLKINNGVDSYGEEKSGYLELEKIYLLKKVAGKGIGSWTVNHIIEIAKEMDIKVIWLKSMDSSLSVQFYKKLGFTKTATERLPYEGFKDEYRNIITMQLIIT